MTKKILIVGAGISGLGLARLFKNNGDYVEVREREKFVGGLAYDYKYKDYYVSKFGPRVLHFRKETLEALNFIKKYNRLTQFNHKVVCIGNGNFTFWPPSKDYIKLFDMLENKGSFKNEFVDSYSKKVWGKDYKELKRVINSRFKFKENSNKDFFEGQQTFMPTLGYRDLFKNLSKNIKIVYGRDENIDTIYGDLDEFDLVFVSSRIDEFFNSMFGALSFKKIKFTNISIMNDGSNILVSPVMNLNVHPKIIRITEYPQFYLSKARDRLIGKETRDEDGVACYPVNTKKNLDKLKKYQEYAKHFENLYFIGRLGTFQYLNFDDACQQTINLYKKLSKQLKGGKK